MNGEARMSSLPEWVARATRFLAGSDEGALCGWLLRGLRDGDFRPLELPPEPPYPIQLQAIFDECEPAAQEKLKTAVCLALREWRTEAHGLRLLEDLALLAAYVRAARTIPLLAAILLDSARIRGWDSAEVEHTRGFVIGVLAGFAPDPDVERALEVLYWDARVALRFGALLFCGLCRCRPAAYHLWLPRLVDLAEWSSEYYRVEALMGEFVRIVGFPTIVAKLPLLENRSLGWLIQRVTEGSPALAKIDTVEAPESSARRYETVHALVDNRTGSYHLCIYEDAAANLRVWRVLQSATHPLKAGVPDFLRRLQTAASGAL